MKRLFLKKGREKAVLRRHPWIFSGAVRDLEGDPQMGEAVDIFDNNGQFLARGAYSPTSQIRARIWTWDESEKVDQGFFHRRIREAIKLREDWVQSPDTSAFRLIHAESDGLPGLVVDKYNQTLILQILAVDVKTFDYDNFDNYTNFSISNWNGYSVNAILIGNPG